MCVNSLDDSSCFVVPKPSDLKNLLPFFVDASDDAPPVVPPPPAAASLSNPDSDGTEAEANCAVLSKAEGGTIHTMHGYDGSQVRDSHVYFAPVGESGYCLYTLCVIELFGLRCAMQQSDVDVSCIPSFKTLG